MPWTVLAGIGKVESDHGRTTLPGVTSGANAFGAAGPMQIGIEGAAGNAVGHGRHRRGRQDPGVRVRPGGRDRRRGEVPECARRAERRVGGDLRVQPRELVRAGGPRLGVDVRHGRVHGQRRSARPASGGSGSSSCTGTGTLDALVTPTAAVGTAISFAQAQLGKPYLWGGTGPGRVRLLGAGDDGVPGRGHHHPAHVRGRSGQQLPHVPAGSVEPGDLVFFAGSDGTPTSPGHVGLVIGHDKMIEAYATGFPIRISTFGSPTSAGGLAAVVGFARPWSRFSS